jgi:hypothetical protein
MRLILTVVSSLGLIEVETDQATVDQLGMRGAIRMLKNRAFCRNPSIKRADCTTFCAYHNARIL